MKKRPPNFQLLSSATSQDWKLDDYIGMSGGQIDLKYQILLPTLVSGLINMIMMKLLLKIISILLISLISLCFNIG